MGALWLDVAPLTAVATPDIWPYFLVGFNLIPAALEPQSSLANEAKGVLVRDCQNRRRRLDGSFVVASLGARRPAQLSDSRGDLDPLVFSLDLPESLRAARPLAQVAGHRDRMDLHSPPGFFGLEALDSWVDRSRRSDHRIMVLEQLVGTAGGLVEPRYFPLLVRRRSWTLACAPSRRSARLMADWTLAFHLVRSLLVLPFQTARDVSGLVGARSIAAPAEGQVFSRVPGCGTEDVDEVAGLIARGSEALIGPAIFEYRQKARAILMRADGTGAEAADQNEVIKDGVLKALEGHTRVNFDEDDED